MMQLVLHRVLRAEPVDVPALLAGRAGSGSLQVGVMLPDRLSGLSVELFQPTDRDDGVAVAQLDGHATRLEPCSHLERLAARRERDLAASDLDAGTVHVLGEERELPCSLAGLGTGAVACSVHR